MQQYVFSYKVAVEGCNLTGIVPVRAMTLNTAQRAAVLAVAKLLWQAGVYFKSDVHPRHAVTEDFVEIVEQLPDNPEFYRPVALTSALAHAENAKKREEEEIQRAEDSGKKRRRKNKQEKDEEFVSRKERLKLRRDEEKADPMQKAPKAKKKSPLKFPFKEGSTFDEIYQWLLKYKGSQDKDAVRKAITAEFEKRGKKTGALQALMGIVVKLSVGAGYVYADGSKKNAILYKKG